MSVIFVTHKVLQVSYYCLKTFCIPTYPSQPSDTLTLPHLCTKLQLCALEQWVLCSGKVLQRVLQGNVIVIVIPIVTPIILLLTLCTVLSLINPNCPTSWHVTQFLHCCIYLKWKMHDKDGIQYTVYSYTKCYWVTNVCSYRLPLWYHTWHKQLRKMFHFLLSCTSLSINYTLRTGCLLPNIFVAMVLLLLYKYIHSTLHTHVPTYTGMHPPTTTHPHSPTHIHTVHTAVNTSMYLRHTVTHTTSLPLVVVVVYRCILLLHSESTSATTGWPLHLVSWTSHLHTLHLVLCTLHLWCFPLCQVVLTFPWMEMVDTSCSLCWWCFSLSH